MASPEVILPNLGAPNFRMNTTIIKTLRNWENHMTTSAENLSVSVQDQDDQLGILQRRRIEANIISPIYQIMKRELGQERASDIIREAITEDAHKAGARFAATEPNGANLLTFIARDFEFIVGYDPTIEITRTKTIMGGDSHCDFHYVRKAQA